MTSKKSVRYLPFINCDDQTRVEALILGGFVCQKIGIVFKVEEFRTTPKIQQCFKCQDLGHKTSNCTKKQKCVVCGEAHSHENCPWKVKGIQNAQIDGDLMSPTAKAVLPTRNKRSDNMWFKTKCQMPRS